MYRSASAHPTGRDLSSEFVDLYPNLPLNFRKSLNQGRPRDGESRNDGVANRDMIFTVLVSDGHLSGRAKEVLNAAGYSATDTRSSKTVFVTIIFSALSGGRGIRCIIAAITIETQSLRKMSSDDFINGQKL
jgi:hypothetical protein